MDVKFTNSVCNCLKMVLCEVTGSEQTQEIKLSDNYPDVGRVIGTWGQTILRSKEWNANMIQCAAGMMVWILYAPEDGSEPRMVNTWVPFQLRWELPDGTPEGKLLIRCLTRFADARSVSPRKIMIRCGIRAQAQAYAAESISVSSAAEGAEGVELLQQRYPVRIRKEAGEKLVQLDEELTLPESAPKPDALIYTTLDPVVTDARVLADKLVFRGNMRLHILYKSTEGQLHSWDFAVPYSQYALLDGTYSSDSQCALTFCITSLEPELQENGVLRLKCGAVCQYLITDREMLEVAEDAYSLCCDIVPEWEEPALPVLLDRRTEKINPEQELRADADLVPDVRFLPEDPSVRHLSDTMEIQWAGTFHVLYYGTDRALHSGSVRWESLQRLPLDAPAGMLAVPGAGECQAAVGNGVITVSAELPVTLEAYADQQIRMLTHLRLGQPKKKEANRPSLILQRCGAESLWDVAKKNGSTMEAIRKANGLQEEPTGDRILLIPVLA